MVVEDATRYRNDSAPEAEGMDFTMMTPRESREAMAICSAIRNHIKVINMALEKEQMHLLAVVRAELDGFQRSGPQASSSPSLQRDNSPFPALSQVDHIPASQGESHHGLSTARAPGELQSEVHSQQSCSVPPREEKATIAIVESTPCNVEIELPGPVRTCDVRTCAAALSEQSGPAALSDLPVHWLSEQTGPAAVPEIAVVRLSEQSAPAIRLSEFSAPAIRLSEFSAPAIRLSELSAPTTFPDLEASRKSRAEFSKIPVESKALVINSSRFITALEFFELLHELAKSTSIAALTLVAAGSYNQLWWTGVFIGLICLCYELHDLRYDVFDITDFEKLISLYPRRPDGNPNRILASVSLSSGRLGRVFKILAYITQVAMLVLGWMLVVEGWATIREDASEQSVWIKWAFNTPEDVEALAVQITVFTFLLLIVLLFELFVTYETTGCMPEHVLSNSSWDPRYHGTPRRFFLGLPSMWYSSAEARDDLKHWISELRGTDDFRVRTEELAAYALESEEARMRLMHCFQNVLLYDSYSQEVSDPPEKLGLHLRFWLADMHHKVNDDAVCVPHSGEYMDFTAEANSCASAMLFPGFGI